MDTISVIVPTYNQARYLPVCLDSIWFQEYPDIEIIVVNDGSPDDTAEVLARYEKELEQDMVSYAANYNERTDEVERCIQPRYPAQGRRFRVIDHKQNKGLSHALNTGFKAASGELCTFIASDDYFLPSAMSVMAQALREHDVDFVYADMHIVDDAGRICRRFSLPDYSFQDSLCRWYLMGICKLYKRSLHQAHGYYDPEIAPQDHDMYQRFAVGGSSFRHVPSVLACARIHDKDRQVGNHDPSQWSKLYRQSSQLVMKAREHARSKA